MIRETHAATNLTNAAEATSGKHLETAESLKTLADSALAVCLTGLELNDRKYDPQFGYYSPELQLVPLGEIIPVMQYGSSEAAVEGGRYPMLRMMDLRNGLATDENLCHVDLSVDDFERYRLCDGDVLFNRTNSHDLVGRTGVYRLRGEHVFASYLIRLRVDTARVLPDFVCAFMNHPVGRRQVLRFATRGVSQSNVNANSLRRMVVPLPTLLHQEQTVAEIAALKAASEQHRARAKLVREVASNICNSCLGAS